MKQKETWIKEVKLFLDDDRTKHLSYRAEDEQDPETLVILLKRAKKVYANTISEADQLINFKN